MKLLKHKDITKLFDLYKNETKSFNTIITKYNRCIKGIDHVAFRSLGSIQFDNKYILQPDTFKFNQYNANAEWLKVDNDFKRVFLSYYEGHLTDDNFSDKNKIKNIMDKKKLSYEDYYYVQSKNQYLAWTLLHKNKLNHVALEVFDIHEIVDQLINDGYTFNIVDNSMYSFGKKNKLIQASLMADKYPYKFSDGEKIIPYSFVEFIQRVDNVDGFDTNNANNIVTSTANH